MAKFGLGNYKTDFGEWAKHHKEIAIHIKRDHKSDKENVEVNDETLMKVIRDNKDKIIKKEVSLRDKKTYERSEAIDHFLPLKNLNYKNRNVEHYSVGASNTKQNTKLRLVFKLEYVDFITDYSYKSEGSFATSFYDLLNGFDCVGDILEELAEDSEVEFADKGIMPGEEEDFYIVGIDEYKRPIEFEISKSELLKSLIAIEVYEHEMEIL